MINWILNLFENKTFGAQRSPKWSEVRRGYIALYPNCAVCDKKGTILSSNEAHHCVPFHLQPEMELNPKNLITLCREHHLFFGHLGNFKSINENVELDCALWFLKIKNRK